ncbi:serine/threonine-protein kinase STY46-like, partial [Anneissia japonica]|uniref:serine/threonine-protein kinase STY46-like n=1 Tax=Anneissia japonica TaxID=1529436 RepID=UPI001425AABF
MEFLAGGNLYEHLAKNREERTPFPLWQCLNWAGQCARGLKYLHENGITHKNIQSYNYLLSSVDVTNCTLKLSNFGLTKPEHTSYAIITTWHGSSMPWRAPEVISDPTFGKKYSDVYSLGVVIWELLTCNKPWDRLSDREISNAVQSGNHLEIPKNCPTDLKRLMEKCWERERASRPKIFNICASLECLYKE